MGQPSQPVFLIEGPASACVINGQALGWKNCTPLSFAMGMYKSTLGRVTMSGCAVRRETGDVIGGTTIEQCAKVAVAHGVSVEIHTGSRVCSPSYAATQLQAGRGFSLAGNTSAIGKGNVNHNIWINQARGGGIGVPAEAYVYDPWSKGPAWWAWSKVLAFAAALRPWGVTDPRLLGPGKFYCGIFPDTEPHVHLRVGAIRTVPFPDRMVVHSPVVGARINVRSGPGKTYKVLRNPPNGEPWTAFQKVLNGGLDRGSRVWYGNHDNTEWIHESGLTGKGGTL
jgi:hypothetical protein